MNRLNVSWCGKRTTARFPHELWELALAARGCSSAELGHSVRQSLAFCEMHGFMVDSSASEIVRELLMAKIHVSIVPPRPRGSKASVNQLNSNDEDYCA